jgi:phage shock protein C
MASFKRSATDRRIAGVCGGLAETFNIDPTWVRLAFVLLFFLKGSALFLYLVLWLVMPAEITDEEWDF